MNRILSSILITFLLTIGLFNNVKANQERSGQAGATQLLINPWTKSSGWSGANSAGMNGVEAMRYNIAGVVNMETRSEFNFARTNWLSGSGIYINSLGFAQKLGEDDANAFGISLVSFNFGDIELTTGEHPEGGIGYFSPQYFNLGVGYSRLFAANISGGVVLRIISESIRDVRAQGTALDAGIQYKTGENDRVKFGISLRNIGPPMKFSGDGLAVRGTFDGADFELTLEQRSSQFELPSHMNIGATYDFFLDTVQGSTHRLTLASVFISNAFSTDQIAVGLEYSYRNILMVRTGYLHDFDELYRDDNANVFLGPSAGMTLEIPMGEDSNTRFGIDYSFRPTYAFNGTHNFGARILF